MCCCKQLQKLNYIVMLSIILLYSFSSATPLVWRLERVSEQFDGSDVLFGYKLGKE